MSDQLRAQGVKFNQREREGRMTTEPDVKAQIEQALTPILWDQTGMTQDHFDRTMRALCDAILLIVERETAKLREDAEQTRVQLAGCLTAAEGATNNPAKQGDYGWSLAYQRTLELQAALAAMTQERDEWRNARHIWEATLFARLQEITGRPDDASVEDMIESLAALQSRVDATVAWLRKYAEMRSWATRTFCPEHGPQVRIDEDGCCATCGAQATGNAVEALVGAAQMGLNKLAPAAPAPTPEKEP